MPNTNAQTIHQMGQAINSVVRQATGRDAVENIDMDFVTVAQNKTVLSVSDRVPYLRRSTGGGVNIGNATLARDKIIGGSLARNQLAKEIASDNYTVSGGTVAFENGVATVSATGNYGRLGLRSVPSIPAGHIVFMSVDLKTNYTHIMFPLNYRINGFAGSLVATPNAGSWETFTKIASISTGSGTDYFYFGDVNTYYTPGDVTEVRNPLIVDITQMFGTTIADYIYSLETANAGAGVAFFREFFPNDYYDYNAGELKSVEGLQSHKTTGDGWERTYPLDSSLTLRGIPKLDSNNKLYYDGDEYQSNGTVTRKYGIVDLGTLTWNLSTYGSGNNVFISEDIPTKNNTGIGNIPSIQCGRYVATAAKSATTWNTATDDRCISLGYDTAKVWIRDTGYSDSASFKTAMSGVYLVYELATPTTETATPYTDPQEVSANGTEQYVTNSIIPVGHETDYLELVEV